MKQYYSRLEAPLAFHKFFWYVSLPIGFLVTLGNLVEEISGMVFFNWIYAIEIGFFLANLSLTLLCFVGFFKWKSYAWRSVMILLPTTVANNIFIVIVYALFLPSQIGTSIGRLVGVIIYAILVGIYYKKRRPLFFVRSQDATGAPTNTEEKIPEGLPTTDLTLQAKYCRKCGFLLLEGSIFCSRCGTPIIKG